MICLGIDTASKAASVAIMRDDELIYDMVSLAGRTHSETMLLHIKHALCSLGLTMQDIDLIGANKGPGSFTGLRIGLALAKGLAAPNDTLCVGVRTTKSLAYASGVNGTVLCVLNARRGNVYYGIFKRRNGVVTRLCEDSTDSALEVKIKALSLERPLYITGDGTPLFEDVLASEPLLFSAENAVINGRASGVCLAALNAYKQGKATSANELLPEYLRLSQAERERIEKEQKF